MVVGLSAVRMGVRVRVPMPVSFGTRSQRFRSAIHLVRRTAFHLHLHRGVTDPETVLAAARVLLTDLSARAAMARAMNPYGDGRAAERIRLALQESLLTK